LLLINWPPEILAQTIKPALDFDPYISGGMLLARQTFRRLFRSENVEEKEGLGIRQVTLLFTDLKGSTAIYERLGDLNAYALVREHFALLGATVQEHSGAIVKTIGDAVIGAHCGPSIAVSLNENLDYFGQTVNVAARVQSLADAGEICISEALFSAPGVSKLLAGHRLIAFEAPLPGVEGIACVYRVMPN
jgi:class 3 adenylate cyclase